MSRPLRTIQPATPYTIQTIPGFPFMEWTQQVAYYEGLQHWYSGQVLNEKDKVENIEQYPIKINPLKTTARRHTSVLFGVNLDSINFGGVPVRFIPQPETLNEKSDESPSLSEDTPPAKKEDSAEQGQIKRIRNALNNVWTRNNGGAMFYANAMMSQYLGGHIFAAKWRPDNKPKSYRILWHSRWR
jgi:hypothetical protein